MKIYSSLSQIQKDLENGAITCSELVSYYLENIEAHKDLNAFVEVYDDEARSQASAIDEEYARGTPRPLSGLIIGVKDLIAHKDHSVQGASAILDGYTSAIDATAIERLEAQGAIVIGRQNCDEFGMGSSNENSVYEPALNGIDKSLVPGGSSGGSAVAVQMNMCLASLGTDTGGSVRQPAAFCGIIGLKPTYSRISRFGLLAYASSFDSVGVLAKSIEDVKLILNTVQGPDENDSTSYSGEKKSTGRSKPFRIACFKEGIEHDGLDPQVSETMKATISQLQNEGNIVDLVNFELLDYALPTYYILTTAEASTNLSRYDGVRYGHRSDDSSSLEDMYKNTRTEGFGKEVIRRIMLGTFVLSEGYYDAYYSKAQKMRRLIKKEIQKVLTDYDFIMLPTTPGPAFELGKERNNPVEMYLEDLFTVPASVSGLPAISLPLGRKGDLPLGIQVIADEFQEDDLLGFSEYLLTLG